MRKNFDDLNDIEKQTVQDFVQSPRPGLGIESVVLTAEESYVLFSDPES